MDAFVARPFLHAPRPYSCSMTGQPSDQAGDGRAAFSRETGTEQAQRKQGDAATRHSADTFPVF